MQGNPGSFNIAHSDEHSSRSRYNYHALPNQHSIRIMKLEPASPIQSNEPLQCTLFDAGLGQLGNYLALSYTWGPREPVKQLRIDDGLLQITPNLHAALLQLRTFWPCPVYLWVDAVCVNQEDLEERAQQVLLMKTIYQSARNTFSWLGEADAQAEQFFSLIDTIHERVCLADSCSHGKSPRIGDMPFENAEAMTQLRLPPPNHPSWRTLVTLAERTYFSRIWIIQETVCGHDNSWLFCGKLKVSWHCLETVARYVKAQNLPKRILFQDFSSNNLPLRHGWPSLQAHVDVRLLVLYDESKAGIERLLRETRMFHATDPRDKVIGILGLVQDVGPGKRFEIVPSYTKPVAEFYRDATAILLQQGSSLDMLAEIEDPLFREIPNLPSWVPDYSVTDYRPVARHNVVYKGFFHASRDSRVSVRWTEGSNCINIGGHEVDHVWFSDRCVSRDLPHCRDIFLRWFGVKAVSSPSTGGLIDMSRPKSWFSSLLRPLADSSDWFAERFWRTLVGDHMNGVDADEVRQRFRTCLFKTVADCAAVRNGLQPPSLMAASMIRQFDRDIKAAIEEYVREGNEYIESNDEDVAAFQSAWVGFCNNSAIFDTGKGRLGIGHASMGIGDVVCVLYGSPMLHILRPRGQVYRYVGEAYVYDLMNGEALLENDKQMSEFCIE